MTNDEAVEQILNEQVGGYRQLLELLQQERLCLIDLDAAAAEELFRKKDLLLLRLRLLEEERVRLMNRSGRDGITLEKLGELTGNRAFFDLRSKLRSLMQSIEELNSFNRLLIERSLSYFRTNSGFFRTLGLNEGMSQKGMLLSRET